jgi:hypothetical protein
MMERIRDMGLDRLSGIFERQIACKQRHHGQKYGSQDV